MVKGKALGIIGIAGILTILSPDYTKDTEINNYKSEKNHAGIISRYLNKFPALDIPSLAKLPSESLNSIDAVAKFTLANIGLHKNLESIADKNSLIRDTRTMERYITEYREKDPVMVFKVTLMEYLPNLKTLGEQKKIEKYRKIIAEDYGKAMKEIDKGTSLGVYPRTLKKELINEIKKEKIIH